MRCIKAKDINLVSTFEPLEWAGTVQLYEQEFPVGSIVVVQHYRKATYSIFRVVSNASVVTAFHKPNVFDRRDILQTHERIVRLERIAFVPFAEKVA